MTSRGLAPGSFSRPQSSFCARAFGVNTVSLILQSVSTVPCRAMASCKHIRWCASLLNGARGRGFSTQSLSLEGTAAGDLIAALQPHVNDGGKPLLSALTKFFLEERVLLHQLQRDRERVLLQELLQKGRDTERVHLQELLQKERELLNIARESRAQGRLDLLRAKGLNNTRGLFEWLQENLAAKSNITSRLKGAVLWEDILKVNAGLSACIEKCTNVPATHVEKQALNCYNVFSILSQHVHAGKDLADLQVARGGTIKFERGPLSPEQVEVLLCIGAAAQVALEENTE